MKYCYLLLSFLSVISVPGIADEKITYSYDAAGNRILRKYEVVLSNPNPVKKYEEEPAPVSEEMGERKITVYPNPTKGALAVEVIGGDEKDEMRITLYSVQGTVLQNRIIAMGTTPVDMSAYASGNYILRIQAGKETLEFKIIKE